MWCGGQGEPPPTKKTPANDGRERNDGGEAAYVSRFLHDDRMTRLNHQQFTVIRKPHRYRKMTTMTFMMNCKGSLKGRCGTLFATER